MPKLFFASDLHLSHPNILIYEPQRVEAAIQYIMRLDNTGNMTEDQVRASVNETLKDKKSDRFSVLLRLHDDMIIDNWNSVVGDDDYVIFGGDFAFCHKGCAGSKNFDKLSEETKSAIISFGHRLKGHKIMIMGNHDWRSTYKEGPLKGIYYVKPEIEKFWLDVGFEKVYANPQVFKDYFEVSHEPSPYYSPAMVRVNIFGHVHSDPRYATETENSFCMCIDKHNLFPVEYKKFNEFVKEE